MSLRIRLTLFGCLAAVATCLGQQALMVEDAHARFVAQARTDGVSEIGLVFSSEQDEWDYWNDQRAYERQLYQENATYYAAYILAKRAVYATHQSLCGDPCQHGDYFYIQSAFYLQFAEADAALLTAMEENQKTRGVEGLYKY